MLKLSGNFEHVKDLDFTRKMFRVTTNYNLPKVLRDNCIFLNKNDILNPDFDFQITFNKNNLSSSDQKIIFLEDDFRYLNDDDVLVFDTKSKRTRVLYRTNSPNNYILLTERCNHYCLMCSQPPKNIDDSFLINEAMELVDYLPRELSNFGLTGGEPTLYGNQLITLITLIDILRQ